MNKFIQDNYLFLTVSRILIVVLGLFSLYATSKYGSKKPIEIIINLFFLIYMGIQVLLILQEFSKKKPTKWMRYYAGIITVLLAALAVFILLIFNFRKNSELVIIFISWMSLFGVIDIYANYKNLPELN